MSERPFNRRFPRMTSARSLSYRPVDGGPETTALTVTKSIGLGGLMFETQSPPELGGQFVLALDLPDGPLHLTGRVVYVRPLGSGTAQVGMSFENTDAMALERLEAAYLREAHRLNGT